MERQARLSLYPVYGNILDPVQKRSNQSSNPSHSSRMLPQLKQNIKQRQSRITSTNRGSSSEILLRTIGQDMVTGSYEISGLEVANLESGTFFSLPEVISFHNS